MISGGIAGVIALTADDPNLAAGASAYSGGIGAISSGTQATITGIRMVASPNANLAGKITGGVFIVIGIIATVFGVNEVVSSFTGENFLKDWMGEDLYKGLYIGFTLAATIASIAGNLYLRNLAKQARAISEDTRKLVEATKDADDAIGGVSQKLIDDAAQAKDYVKLNELLNARASNIAADVLREFPEKSAMWRGTEIHKRMVYTTDALKEVPLGSYGRLDAVDNLGYLFELKPNTAWSIAKGWTQLANYGEGIRQSEKLKDIGEIIKLLIKY